MNDITEFARNSTDSGIMMLALGKLFLIKSGEYGVRVFAGASDQSGLNQSAETNIRLSGKGNKARLLILF